MDFIKIRFAEDEFLRHLRCQLPLHKGANPPGIFVGGTLRTVFPTVGRIGLSLRAFAEGVAIRFSAKRKMDGVDTSSVTS